MNPRKDRYLQLIDYLKEYSKLRERTVYDIERSKKYITTIWNEDIPESEEIKYQLRQIDEDEGVFLSIKRPIEPKEPNFPRPSGKLALWIDAITLKNYKGIPTILPLGEEGYENNSVIKYEEMKKYLETYIADKWTDWAAQYTAYVLIKEEYEKKKKLYFQLFEAYNKIQNFPEAFELVVGVGLFKYCSRKKLLINRHILNFKLEIEFKEKGNINLFLQGDEDGFKLETEMLSPLIEEGLLLSNARNKLVENLTDKDLFDSINSVELKEAVRVFTNLLSASASFKETKDKPKSYFNTPTISFSPAIILREKSQKGYAQVYENIYHDIKEGGVTAIPLLDSFIGFEMPSSFGGANFNGLPNNISNSKEIIFPKKYNAEQVKIIKQSRVKRRVLVQGPPGTGKSHTIANLICNLLGEGKSVLVTAQTNRALEVLINHIPESFHQLVIFLLEIGNRGETTLNKSIKGLQDSLNDVNIHDLENKIQNFKEKLDWLKREKATLNNELLAIIESDVRKIEMAGYGEHSLLEHTKKIKVDAVTNDWWTDEIKELANVLELTEKIGNYKKLLQTVSLFKDNPNKYFIPKKENLISSQDYRLLLKKIRLFQTKYKNIKRSQVLGIPINAIDRITELTSNLTSRSNIFQLDDYYSISYKQLAFGKNAKWTYIFSICEQLLTANNRGLFEEKRNTTCFYPADKSKKQILADTKIVLAYIEQGNEVIGFLKNLTLPKNIKERKYIYTDISFNNHAVTTETDLRWVIKDLECQILLEEVGSVLEIPINQNDIREFLEVKDRQMNLLKLMDIAKIINDCTNQLATVFNKPKEFFEEVNEVKKIEELVAAAQLAKEIAPLEKQLRNSYKYLQNATTRIHPKLADMTERILKLNAKYYDSQLLVINTLEKERKIIQAKEALKHRLMPYFPELIKRMETEAFLEKLDIANIQKAIYWKNGDQLLQTYLSESTTFINEEIKTIEAQLLKKSELLLLNQAILGFVKRITSVDGLINLLQKWQQAIEQGKTMSKRAIRFRRQARAILTDIKDKIPCWVIPLNRLTETLKPKQGTFDYIIIDEASQIGAEGIFLNYIAKNIIIVGDDKQTSPQTVGVEIEEINQLIDTHLVNIPNRDFFGTENSFFDHAKMTSGISIVLKEHFRCMPEIIEFCNQEFYAPEGINLIPLRSFSKNRLEPLKHKFVSSGYTENHINQPEAEALVTEMKKCIAAPRYKGKSIGVITLLGNKQASTIGKIIEKEIDTKEVINRKIICGKAADFQGDERDVIFLSMVSSLSPSPKAKGMAIINNKKRKQEYNVAVSRAKDQLWLIHSLQPSDFGYGDLRLRLVNHFYQLEDDTNKPDIFISPLERKNRTAPKPFDSWFEVDVYEKLKEKGLIVFPQYKVGNYSIDLVIMLNNGYKLAVECDGDRYHSGDNLQRDIERQRLLERVGWEFFRIRGSQYYYDSEMALKDLWLIVEMRETINIKPTIGLDAIGASVEKSKKIASPIIKIEKKVLTKDSTFPNEFTSLPYIAQSTSLIDLSIDTGQYDLLIFTNRGNVYKLYNRKRFEFLIKDLRNLNIYQQTNEKPICQLYTQDYRGFMVFGFKNGKVAKINLNSYQTKQKRSCLLNAFNKEQKLLFIRPIFSDKEILVKSVKNKVLIFSTSLILAKNSRNSQGNQVLKFPDSVEKYLDMDKFQITNKDYYYRERIPSAGFYFKGEDHIIEKTELVVL